MENFKKILILFLAGGFAGCAIVFVFSAAKSFDTLEIERRLIFKPEKQTYSMISALAHKTSEGYFLSTDGTKISYIRVKGNKKFPVVIFCHGNARNITSSDNQQKLKFLVQEGYEIFALDYRGFGKSEGKPYEKGLYQDLDSFTAHIKSKYGISNSETVLWGHSLGSAVVINEAAQKDFAGVIIEGAFTSIEDMRDFRIQHKRDANAVHLFIRDKLFLSLPLTQKFDSKRKIASIKSPVLIIHALNDEMIPFQMAKEFHRLKSDAKIFFSPQGTHCSFGWQDSVILDFLGELD